MDRGALEPAHRDRGCHGAPSIPGLPERKSPSLRELRVQPQPSRSSLGASRLGRASVI